MFPQRAVVGPTQEVAGVFQFNTVVVTSHSLLFLKTLRDLGQPLVIYVDGTGWKQSKKGWVITPWHTRDVNHKSRILMHGAILVHY